VRTLWLAAAPTQLQAASKAEHALHQQEGRPQTATQRGFCQQKPSGETGDTGAPAKARRLKSS